MAEFYPYLIASLPALYFGMKPSFSFEKFLEICHPFIPEKDYRILSTLPQPEHYSEEARRHPIIDRWIRFDTALRNEMVKQRAARQHVEAATYLRPWGYSGPSLAPIAATANMSPSILDGERIIDEARWRMLDALATAHYFDLDLLITYGYKVLILHRWENMRIADKTLLLEEALGLLEG